MGLRPYQKRAFDSVIDHIKYCIDPCLVEAATGAGKSHIIASVAEWIHKETGKKILITAPTSDLVTQDHEKYPGDASIFCASAGRKELDHPVVFGSPLTILNSIDQFCDQFCAVIVDEGDGLTTTLKRLIANLREKNPNLRVIGFTATPFRMRTGYIYQYDISNKMMRDALEPYYTKLVCKIGAKELIDLGYLSPPISVLPETQSYDTTGLVKNNLGFTKDSLDAVYKGQGRKTAAIVAEVVEVSSLRNGVMFFAQTISHANEIMESLPPGEAMLVIGETKGRKKILAAFKRQEFKYLVNVNVLTIGFDAPHVDCIAILRPTESARLLQQIIGRGLRICEGKLNCLILDYAENIERHELEDDLFNPKIKTWESKESEPIDVQCPMCFNVAQFGFRTDKDYQGLKVNEQGYFLDLMGNVLRGDFGEIPAHYGRRCVATKLIDGHFERCEFRWTFKPCEHCEAENDIAARRCCKCKKEMVNPNDKLRLEFKRMKKDPKVQSTDKVIAWQLCEHTTGKGRVMVKVVFKTDYRAVPMWIAPDMYQWDKFCETIGVQATTVTDLLLHSAMGRCKMPSTITSRKVGDFFRVSDYNLSEDEEV